MYNIFPFLAYVCGEKSGLILEKPFAMGETLNGNNKIDINAEMRLVEHISKQLIEQCCSQEETKQAMKDLGMKRFVSKFKCQNL